MKKQLKTNLFTAALGLALIGVMLSSSATIGAATTANQAPILQGLPFSTPASIPFTVYLSLCTAFTNGQSIDFNAMDEDGQSSILGKMNNWREEQ
jgi:hypothetical protein